MSLAAVRAALETKLATITPALATVFGNSPYTGSQGTPYQRVFMIPAEPLNDEISSSFAERGVMQVNLAYPSLAGDGAAEARAILIQAAFKRKLSLPAISGVITSIWRTPHIGAGFTNDEGRWVVPVRIRYFAPITVA